MRTWLILFAAVALLVALIGEPGSNGAHPQESGVLVSAEPNELLTKVFESYESEEERRWRNLKEWLRKEGEAQAKERKAQEEKTRWNGRIGCGLVFLSPESGMEMRPLDAWFESVYRMEQAKRGWIVAHPESPYQLKEECDL